MSRGRSHPLPIAGTLEGMVDVPPLPPHANRAERERLLATLHQEMRTCAQCAEAGYLVAANGVAGFRGHVGDRLMLVGQAPGHLSVERGEPFSGPSGRVLDGWLHRAGFPPGALRTQVYLSALTKCDPGKHPSGNGDRKPSLPELALCRPFLLRELELVRPRAILLVGGMAIEAFLGPAKLEAVVGTAVDRNGVHLLPLPHPSGVSRWLNEPAHQALVARALDLLAGWRLEWQREDSVNSGGTHDGDI